MARKKNPTAVDELMSVSDAAKKFWGKTIEDALPKPTIPEDIALLSPSFMLLDILQYARGAESRGEWLFRQNYMKPMLNHFKETSVAQTTTWFEDEMGNLIVQVGAVNGVMHVGHMDTVHHDDHSPLQSIALSSENIVTVDPIVKNSIPTKKVSDRWLNGVKVPHVTVEYELPPKLYRCLGADDGCALAVMLYLIAYEINGTYVFTRGEEIGCVGTHYLIDNDILDWSKFSMAIEVDRKNKTEIVGKMSPGITASQSFVASLAKELNMGHTYSDKGSMTDIGLIAKLVPECVNIAAGYNLQHSEREHTDIAYLDRLGDAMLNVNWDSLVVVRPKGQYHTPVPITSTTEPYVPYNPYRGYNAGMGQSWQRNSYGDYADEPSEGAHTLFEMYPDLGGFQYEQYVRKNMGFIVEFLLALSITPAEMDIMIQTDNIEEADEGDIIEAEIFKLIQE